MSTPLQTIETAISEVINSEGVPAKDELLAVLAESAAWERKVIMYRDSSKSDNLMVAYAAALIKELEVPR